VTFNLNVTRTHNTTVSIEQIFIIRAEEEGKKTYRPIVECLGRFNTSDLANRRIILVFKHCIIFWSRESGGKGRRIFNLSIRLRWVVSLTLRVPFPQVRGPITECIMDIVVTEPFGTWGKNPIAPAWNITWRFVHRLSYYGYSFIDPFAQWMLHVSPDVIAKTCAFSLLLYVSENMNSLKSFNRLTFAGLPNGRNRIIVLKAWVINNHFILITTTQIYE
jgi:hypothetical protein